MSEEENEKALPNEVLDEIKKKEDAQKDVSERAAALEGKIPEKKKED